jgi:hypothetical protein
MSVFFYIKTLVYDPARMITRPDRANQMDFPTPSELLTP